MQGIGAGQRFLILVLLPAALLCVLLLAQPVQAGILVATTDDCAEEVLSQPFAPWGDDADYTPVPGGSFEGGSTSWSLDDAALVAGNEPWNVNAPEDSTSLRIEGDGGSATSPSICVGRDHPTMRFFVRSQGSYLESLLSAMLVEVRFEDAGGTMRTLPIGIVKSPVSWKPSSQFPIIANLLALRPDERMAVAFRFTSLGGADWQIDDVYVDPKSRR